MALGAIKEIIPPWERKENIREIALCWLNNHCMGGYFYNRTYQVPQVFNIIVAQTQPKINHY